jgi:hypothetical protein
MFFFEKKSQKTFIRLEQTAGRQRAPHPNKSLSASFSTEKEAFLAFARSGSRP